MCLSCGCDSPNDDHGDSKNITMQSLEAAAAAGDVESTAAVVKNIQTGFESATKGQTAGARQNS